MGQIFLIRHGQAAFGELDYDALTPLGEQQARETGRHLKGSALPIERVVTGEMKRQKQSASQALDAMESLLHPQVDAAFNEFDHLGVIAAAHPLILKGTPELIQAMEENFSNRTFQPFFAKAVDLWVQGRLTCESYKAFTHRVLEGLHRMAMNLGKGESVALFTSGGAISVMAASAMGLDLDKALGLSWTLRNGSITTLIKGKKGLSLLDFGCAGHLAASDPGLLTFR